MKPVSFQTQGTKTRLETFEFLPISHPSSPTLDTYVICF